MPSPVKPKTTTTTTTTPAKGTPMLTGSPLPIYGKTLFDYIFERSKQLGLDPYAVESVVPHEGGYQGAVGDSGSSFGPFQLHEGGALPSEIMAKGRTFSASWANSPLGLDYALQGIRQAVPQGSTGYSAIESQVINFERPSETLQAGEIARSKTSYDQLKAQATLGGSDPGAAISGFLGDATGAGFGAIGATAGVVNQGARLIPGVAPVEDFFAGFKNLDDLIHWLTNGKNIIRVGEVIAGGILTTIGMIMFARSLMAPSSNPVSQARGSASTVAGAAAAPVRYGSKARASQARRNAPRPRTPISQQPRAVRKKAGFTLPVDQKPARRVRGNGPYGKVPY